MKIPIHVVMFQWNNDGTWEWGASADPKRESVEEFYNHAVNGNNNWRNIQPIQTIDVEVTIP